MTTIAERLERLEATVGQRPGFGSATTSCRASLDSALRCTVVEGEWRIETDLPRALGGAGSAPSPSVVLRAALGACMAM
ncbi:MAG: OsmC family protein, partial [Acidimicrobiia bacterium]